MEPNKKWYTKTLWIAVLLVFFFPVGLFLMWKYSNWNKFVKWGITIFFGLVILGSATTPASKTESITETKPTPTTSIAQPTVQPTEKPVVTSTPQPAKPFTMTERVWIAIDKAFGTRKDYAAGYSTTEKTAILTMTVNEAWDESALVRATYTSLVKYGREVFKLPDVNSVEIIAKTTFTDKYGKDNVEKAVDIVMSKTEFQKFNWDNLRYMDVASKIESSSDVYYIHPAIMKNLKADKLYLSL